MRSKVALRSARRRALALTLAKKPEMPLLDEPLSNLDPLARREFMQVLMDAVAEEGLTVVLSSHIIADLERTCDYLVILAQGQVQLAGEIEGLLDSHRTLVGGPSDRALLERDASVIHSSHTPRQTTMLVKGSMVQQGCSQSRSRSGSFRWACVWSSKVSGPRPSLPSTADLSQSPSDRASDIAGTRRSEESHDLGDLLRIRHGQAEWSSGKLLRPASNLG
jgi:ABC-type multidrug transport system ATPase subunit